MSDLRCYTLTGRAVGLSFCLRGERKRECLLPSNHGAPSPYPESPRVTWSSPRVTCSHPGSPGVTQSHLESPGVTWSHRRHPESPGVTRTSPRQLESIPGAPDVPRSSQERPGDAKPWKTSTLGTPTRRDRTPAHLPPTPTYPPSGLEPCAFRSAKRYACRHFAHRGSGTPQLEAKPHHLSNTAIAAGKACAAGFKGFRTCRRPRGERGVIFENWPQELFWDPGVVKIGFLAKNIPISANFIIFRPIFENRDLS